jgi:lysophospholipase L1-like esterase
MSGVINALAGMYAGVPMPDGALAVWHIDQFQSSPRAAIPNRRSAQPISANLINFPCNCFSLSESGWACFTATDNYATHAATGNKASRILNAGGGGAQYVAINSVPLAAGTYTMAIDVKSNTGSSQNFKMAFWDTNGTSGTLTATTSWQSFSWTYTLVSDWSSGHQIYWILSPDGGTTGVDLQIANARVFAGTSDLGAETISGHWYLGGGGTSFLPTYSGGELDFQGPNGVGSFQFANAAPVTLTAFTAIATIKRATADASIQYNAIMSMVQDYTKFTMYGDHLGFPSAFFSGNAIENGEGFCNIYGQPYYMMTHVYDGTTYSIWIDNFRIWAKALASASQAISSLWFSNLKGSVGFQSVNKYCGISAFYNRALSQSEIDEAFRAVQINTSLHGLSVPGGRMLVAEGDSITAASGNYATLFAQNSSPPVSGADAAITGSSLSDVINRATVANFGGGPALNTYLPMTPLAGQKSIYTVLIGANDGAWGGGSSAYITALSNFLDGQRTAGWTVGICTILPQSAAHTGFNTFRNAVNTAISGWVGTHCDFIIDFAANSTIGTDAAGDNATYYPDGEHPSAACYTIMETVYRAAVNAQ